MARNEVLDLRFGCCCSTCGASVCTALKVRQGCLCAASQLLNDAGECRTASLLFTVAVLLQPYASVNVGGIYIVLKGLPLHPGGLAVSGPDPTLSNQANPLRQPPRGGQVKGSGFESE